MPPPLAYSYIRFSSAAQAEGDSLRRQSERAAEYCKRRGWKLDESLTLRDLGVSAFRGKNAAVGNFRTFLDAIKGGRVPPGSILIVESFDRISRQGIDEGYDLIKSILKADVKIVTLSPEREFDRDATKSLSKGALEIQLILERAAEESERKSDRIGAAWARKRSVASEKPMTRRVPVWVKYNAGKLELDRAKMKVVKRLLRMAVDGIGLTVIATTMNREKVPVLGHKQYEGGTVVWSAAMVHKIITSRALLGEYQPHMGSGGNRKPVGAPILDYYPRAVKDEEFAAVQAALRTRWKVGRGRHGKFVTLFAGLLKDARSGGHFISRFVQNREPSLVSISGLHGRGGKWTNYPLRPFEDAVLSKLAEVKVEELQPDGAVVSRAKALRDRRAEQTELIAKWRAKMDRPELVDIVADKLAELEEARRDTEAELADAERGEGMSLAEAMGHVQTLAKSLAKDSSDENRLRCRAAIRAAVESISCLFMPGRSWRLAVVQVRFKGGAHRDYLIASLRAAKNARSTRPAALKVFSFADIGGPAGIDLRTKTDVAIVEAFLADINVPKLVGQAGQEPAPKPLVTPRSQ